MSQETSSQLLLETRRTKFTDDTIMIMTLKFVLRVKGDDIIFLILPYSKVPTRRSLSFYTSVTIYYYDCISLCHVTQKRKESHFKYGSSYSS